jgi:hypothetical protein
MHLSLLYKFPKLKLSASLIKLISCFLSQRKFSLGRRWNVYTKGYTRRSVTRFRPVPNIVHHIVTYRPVAKRWLCKQRPLLGNARNIHSCNNKTTGLCDLFLSNGSEAGSNTSIVTLRVVGGDEKGSLKSETVKYDRESQGTRTRERLRWQGPAVYTSDRPVLSSERTSHKKQDRNCQTVINIWSRAPDGARHQDLLTDWLTVSRNVTLTLTWPVQLSVKSQSVKRRLRG